MLQASEKLLAHLPALTGMVRRVAVEAGDATLEHLDESGYVGAVEKTDGSPVTAADHAAEAIIEAALADILPGVPIIAEEAAAAGRLPDLAGAEHFWLVDPLDGTKEFVAGRPDYTVNIALIRAGAPVLGVVYAPALEVGYAGCGPATAVRWREGEDGARAEKPVQARRPPRAGLTVLASRSHGRREAVEAFLADQKVAKVVCRGSSLKMCLIAEGKADLYPRLGPTSEWDTAAAQAVLEAAGGALVEVEGGAPLRYGGARPGFLNPHFLARGRG